MLHIAYGNGLLLSIATEDRKPDALKKQIEANAKNEKQAITKDRVVQLLTASFATVRKTLEAARAGALASDVQFFGRSTSQRAVLTVLEVHLAEHTGQAIAYARMNGIVPPWSGN